MEAVCKLQVKTGYIAIWSEKVKAETGMNSRSSIYNEDYAWSQQHCQMKSSIGKNENQMDK